MSDAWWVRPSTPTPTLPRTERPAPAGTDDDAGRAPDLVVTETDPAADAADATDAADSGDAPPPAAEAVEAPDPVADPVAEAVEERARPKPTTVLLTRKQSRQLRALRRSRGIRSLWWPPGVHDLPGVGHAAGTWRPDRGGHPPQGVLAASALGVLALVGAAFGGMILADRPATTTVTAVAARAVPVDRSLVTATATSTQKADGTTDYGASNTVDGDPATAWNSNGARDGKGPGIALTYTFTRPLALRDIVVRNGYQKVRPRAGRRALDLYPVNERVRRLKVVTDAGSWVWELADTRTPQTFAGAAGRTGSVRLEILAVYPSKAYPDVAISEVGFTSTLDH